ALSLGPAILRSLTISSFLRTSRLRSGLALPNFPPELPRNLLPTRSTSRIPFSTNQALILGSQPHIVLAASLSPGKEASKLINNLIW
ncbi:MAG: hypothetical protein QXF23_03575, partial [Candidatus Bathyarchaeia archaeon]